MHRTVRGNLDPVLKIPSSRLSLEGMLRRPVWHGLNCCISCVELGGILHGLLGPRVISVIGRMMQHS